MSLGDLRDIAIIILTTLAIVQLLLLLGVTVLLYRKVLPLIDKVGPVLDSVQATAATVAGTAMFVGEATVSPIIRVASLVAGVLRGIGALGRLVRRRESGR